jgi:hypothetical protein
MMSPLPPCEAKAVVKRTDGFDVITCWRLKHGPHQGVHLNRLNGRLICWIEPAGRKKSDG